MTPRLVAFALVWAAGLVAGLLIRSTSAAHGGLATIVVVLVTALAFGLAFGLTRNP